MNTTALVPQPADELGRVLALAVDRVTSPASKRAYRRALAAFIAWHVDHGGGPLGKAAVQAYRAHLLTLGLAPSSINQQLSAIRALAAEAADNGLLDPTLAAGVQKVKGIAAAGVRAGNWLVREQAQALLDAPDVATLKGLRDRAILGVLLGCGLRRSEVATLTTAHVQQREGRWVVLDLVGKGRRVRSVPMPSWTKAALDQWTQAAGIHTGRVFRAVHKGGCVNGESMSAQAVADVVQEYARPLGFGVAAHDLRRTFAKLARTGDARLEQIQLSLGHASIRTTERYLGTDLDLTDAPCDRLGLRLGAA